MDFRALADTLPGLVFIADLNGGNLYTNACLQAYSGLSAEELLGRSWENIVHPDDRARVARLWSEALAADEPFQAEYRLLSHDGEARWHLVRATPVREGGRIARWVGVCTDIDDQRRAEQVAASTGAARLADLEDRFRTMADAVPAMLFEGGPDGSNSWTSQRWLDFTGLADEQTRGDGWLDAVHPDDAEEHAAAWAAAVASGEPFCRHTRYRRADGAWRWHQVQGVPQRDPSGRIVRWLGSAVDVHDTVEAEASAREAEVRRRLAMETAGLAGWEIDLDTGENRWDDRLAGLLGYSADNKAEAQQRWIETIHPEDRARIAAAFAEAKNGRAPYHETFRVRRLNGEERWLSSRGVLLPGGKRMVGLVEDVTERKSEEARQDFRLALTEALRAAATADAMIDAATALLGRHLGAAQLGFAEVEPDDEHILVRRDWNDGTIASVIGRWRMDDFGPDFIRDLRAGETIVIPDVAADPRTSGPDTLAAYDGINTRAILNVGLIRDGRMVALLFIHHHEVRAWSPDEAALVRETAERLQSAVERARAEVELLANSEQLALAFRAGKMIAWRWDAATDLLRWSEEGLPLLGLQQQEMAWHEFAALVHPDDKPAMKAALARTIEDGAPYDLEHRLRTADGGWVWTAAAGACLKDEAGRLIGVVGVSRDVTARRQLTVALANSEARFRTIADVMPQIVWSTLADGYHDYFNARWYEFTGVPPGSTDGEGWNGIFHPEDQPVAWERWNHSLKTGEPYEIEYRLRHRSGDYRWVLGRALPVRNDAGEVVRWMGTCTDIHEMVETRRALSKSRADLQAARADLERRVAERTTALATANQRLREEIARREATQAALVQSQKLEALGQLVSGVAHDFNNVIQAVAGGYAVIENRSTDPRLTEVARHGTRAAERGGQLVKQLLAFARQQTLEPTSVDMRELLAEAEPLLARSAGTGVKVTIDCPDGLPPVRVDPTLLETALINLAVNARDAMPAGGALEVTARESSPDEPHRPPELDGTAALAISVADTGRGMSPEVLQRVMEPFFTTKGPGKGTGLGLAMVHGFARQSGGALRIESHEGTGTIVTLYLPQADGMESSDADVTAGTLAPHRRATILLVDDDDEVRAVTAAQLRDTGHQVLEAAGAGDALRHLDRTDVDLVVSDVVMPDTDGVALAAALRGERPELPILFVTGHADRDRLRGERVLDKPFRASDLVAAVDDMLEPAPALRAGVDDGLIERLSDRLRSQCLRSLLAHWRQARGGLPLPHFHDFDAGSCEETHRLIVVEVESTHIPMRFRVTCLSDELDAAAAFTSSGDMPVVGDDEPGSREAAYRRCVRTGKPVYDFARMNLGQGPTQSFERLLLPWSSDGSRVDRLVGMVVIDGF